jgi:hypothetical protein
MYLVRGVDKDCIACSLAMLIGVAPLYIKKNLIGELYYPFPEPWDNLPLVPSMEVICDWLITDQGTALTPFPRNPVCTPHKDCPPVSVWNEDPDWRFEEQCEYGKGLIEGLRPNGVGHMVAWDGKAIHDPSGYIYSLNAADRFNFNPTRFWLATKVKDD